MQQKLERVKRCAIPSCAGTRSVIARIARSCVGAAHSALTRSSPSRRHSQNGRCVALENEEDADEDEDEDDGGDDDEDELDEEPPSSRNEARPRRSVRSVSWPDHVSGATREANGE